MAAGWRRRRTRRTINRRGVGTSRASNTGPDGPLRRNARSRGRRECECLSDLGFSATSRSVHPPGNGRIHNIQRIANDKAFSRIRARPDPRTFCRSDRGSSVCQHPPLAPALRHHCSPRRRSRRDPRANRHVVSLAQPSDPAYLATRRSGGRRKQIRRRPGPTSLRA